MECTLVVSFSGFGRSTESWVAKGKARAFTFELVSFMIDEVFFLR